MSHPTSSTSHEGDHHSHPFIPRRERTLSQCERTMQSPSYEGIIHEFCREKGYGHIQQKGHPSELIFVHVSDIDDDYVPKPGDIVSFKKVLMPPKNEKMMAVHIKLLHLAEGVKHESWEEAVEHDIEHRRPSRSDDASHTHEFKDNDSHGNQGSSGQKRGDGTGDKEKKKYEPPIPTRIGKRKKRTRGPEAANKLPQVLPYTRCRLKQLRFERIKDYLLLEEEFIKNQERLKPQEDRHEEERSKVDDIRGSPMAVGTLEEIIDDNHAIVSTSVGSEHYVTIMSFVDKDQLEPGCTVLLNHKVHAVIGVLGDDVDPMVAVMKLEKAPKETYADIGGLTTQIQEIKEAVELPLTHPEYYEEMGIKPPKGVILYGQPGTGKTLLAKAVANQTSATFLRVVGSELIQKYLGDGPKLVRELFRVAEEYAPAIVFIDEIDAIGTKRYDSNSGGEREIQRTMLELLNQLDGFDSRGDVKVIMATNRIDSLDPALIRPGRIDRKIEFPLPDEKTRRMIFKIHTGRMTLSDDVNLEELIMAKDDLSGADIKAICTESGLMALRERRMKVTNEDFRKSKETVLYRKNQGTPEGLYL
ncbi:unnamed protein product [Rotaria magnacalcarata]|uniref:CSD domain-containing protein n=2 Tax=Rotaria magnacalcarata TaxID=392030 RepID=A0A819BJ39_9BILA|nr:unnamed protein product [Rotaria magnacalcarata]CAF2055972.1 unnamed protein product [Rotaria magnacalcarata]CAF3804368.1 unnamed protein product [Rotaria magnacalcarata]CAF3872898.1 unnamed protein product [Rotaria magnacalcarata]CAF3910536.1 unnamed protein product [Rotaria magnacalcarata]